MTQQKSNSILSNSTKKLSVQVTLTGLSFLLKDQSDGSKLIEKKFDTPRTPEELLVELKNAFKEHTDLLSQYNEVNIVYANEIYTVVPQSLFDEQKLSDYLKFNSKILSNDFVAFDPLPEYGLNVIYVPYMNINNELYDRYGSFQYYHSISVLLKFVLNFEKHNIGQRAFLCISGQTFDLVVKHDGNLVMCNSFQISSPEDLAYYTLFCFEQLKLNPDKVDLNIFGTVATNDPNHLILYRYVRNVNLLEENEMSQNFILNNV